MANAEMLKAVKAETDRFLTNQHPLWSKLTERVAEDVGPLLADLVEQLLVEQLRQHKPDTRLEHMHEAAVDVVTWWQERGREGHSYDDYAEDLISKLSAAEHRLPEQMPPALRLPEDAIRHLEAMTEGCRMALRVFRGLMSNPAIEPIVLRYAIDELEAKLKGVDDA